MIKFGKGDRKIEKMRPYLARQERPAGPGWRRSGGRRSSSGSRPAPSPRPGNGGAPHFGWDRAERRVTCYYFYVWDEEFGPAFVKIGSYFPYPIKVWLNGHEWAKRQATQGRDRLDRAGQRVRLLRRPGRAAADLRSARPGPDPGASSTAGWPGCRCR